MSGWEGGKLWRRERKAEAHHYLPACHMYAPPHACPKHGPQPPPCPPAHQGTHTSTHQHTHQHTPAPAHTHTHLQVQQVVGGAAEGGHKGGEQLPQGGALALAHAARLLLLQDLRQRQAGHSEYV